MQINRRSGVGARVLLTLCSNKDVRFIWELLGIKKPQIKFRESCGGCQDGVGLREVREMVRDCSASRVVGSSSPQQSNQKGERQQ